MIDFKTNFKTIDTPKSHAIYGLYEGEELVYIGSSKNLLSRIAHHIYNKKKIINFDSFSYTLIDKSENLFDIEAEEILRHSPKLNRSIPVNSIFVSFDWIRRTHFKGRVFKLREVLADNNIEADYIFRSIQYYRRSSIESIITNEMF